METTEITKPTKVRYVGLAHGNAKQRQRQSAQFAVKAVDRRLDVLAILMSDDAEARQEVATKAAIDGDRICWIDLNAGTEKIEREQPGQDAIPDQDPGVLDMLLIERTALVEFLINQRRSSGD